MRSIQKKAKEVSTYLVLLLLFTQMIFVYFAKKGFLKMVV